MIRLRTLGSLELQDADGADVDALLAQTRRVALLAYLALARPRGFHRRDRLVALFWPEQDEAHARNALSQSVHVLRRALGAAAVVSRADEEIGLDWNEFWCDAVGFDAALDAGRPSEAVELYRGPLLDGFHVSNGARELDRWMDQEREYYANRNAIALEQLAESCTHAGDLTGAVTWRRKLAALDPLSTRGAVALIRAYVAAGEPAQAMQHARVHEALLREELDAPPDPAVLALVQELAASRSNGRSQTALNVEAPAAAPPPDGELSPGRPQESVRTAPAGATSRLRRLAPLALFLGVAGAGGLALSRARNASGVPRIGCVAVLPLADLSRGGAQEYLADGITDALITELAKYERPTVISHTSTARFKTSHASAPEIGQVLGCDGIVEGTVVRDSNRVRVAARLIHAPDDRQLWAEAYERDVSDLLLLERQAAGAIARQVRAVIAQGDSSEGSIVPRVDPETYAIYLRARSAFQSRNPAILNQALALFQQTVARDTAFALGYSGLSDTYRMIGGLGYGPASFWRDSAELLARRALALDDRSAEAHTSLAAILTDDANWPRAEAEYRRAIALKPGYALAHAWYAAMLVTIDRKAEALREIRRATDLDPLTQPLRGLRAQIETYNGTQIDRFRPGQREALVDPTHPGTIASRSLNLARQKHCAEAYDENRKAQALAPNVTMIQLTLVGVRKLCGQIDGARALLDTVEQHADARLMAAYIAEAHVAFGERDSAFAWLERGQWGMSGRMELRMSPLLNPLRADPRFTRLLHAVGMP